MSEQNRAELVSGAELARRLGCHRKRVYYLSKRNKLGYLSVVASNGKRLYVWDGEHRLIDSDQKCAGLANIEKKITSLYLSAKLLREEFIKVADKFKRDEERILSQRSMI